MGAGADDLALTLSRGLARWPGAQRLFGLSGLRWCPAMLSDWARDKGYRCVIGWGARPSGVLGREVARRLGLPYLGLEDGFLRSVGLGSDARAPYSVIVDDLGLYFDARAPSRLEQLLNGQRPKPLPLPALSDAVALDLDAPALLGRTRDGLAAMVGSRLSKYNAAPERQLPPSQRPRVLVVDQCRGDASIPGALANPKRFREMLAAARAEHPRAEILIKVHPAVQAGRRLGHFSAADEDHRTRLLTVPWSPISLLQQVDQVYVVSSQMGLDALLVGVPVSCFGVPFYAGWGLTDDRFPSPRPRRPLRLEQLFAGAYLGYCHYLDPDSGEPCSMERVIEHLGLQRRMFALNDGQFIAYRFPLWKRRHLRRFLCAPGNRIAFISRATQLGKAAGLAASRSPADADRTESRATRSDTSVNPTETSSARAQPRVLLWGAQRPRRLLEHAQRLGCPVWRVEDGFLRSAGLGSDLSAPASWVFDRQGIYFDPRRPSDLERLLAQADFRVAELARAAKLRQVLIETRLSKYNVGERARRPVVLGAAGRRVILVPGQVPGDASLRLGCSGGPATNAELLAQVRREHPDAHILYKPHPDLLRGNRLGDRQPIDPEDYDQLLTKAGIVSCLEVAHEVHTLTSLVGFEALLRGLPVHTYGWPFYAGWGLTIDHHPRAARARPLTLDALVAGVLLRYPRYVNPVTGAFTTPEHLIRLLQQALATRTPAATGSLLLRPVRLLPRFAAACWREWRRPLRGELDAPSIGLGWRLRSDE
ncbi:capsular polysaccharide biosynthesis protein [Halochromatium sp.]